jgi:von Willebrand factor type A domain
VMRKTARVRRPKDWLLLALRTLALIALASAFASPFLVSKSAALPGEKSTVVLLIDRSASMAARDGVGTRFDAACNEAAAYLDKAAPDSANIVWIDAEPDAVYPTAGPNLAYLTDTLKQAKPRPEAGALSAAFDLALRQLASAQGRRELIILSDFQTAAWRDFTPSLPENIVVTTRRFATQSAPNAAVTRLIAQPAQAVAGQDLTLLVQALNFSPDPIRTRLTLDADGSRQTQDIELAPWGASEAAFVLRPAKSGSLPVSATLESDTFPGDDARHAVVTVRDSLRIGVDGSPDTPEYRLFGKIAAALQWLEVSSVSTESRATDFRFVPAWDGSNAEALREAAIQGTAMIVRPAPVCPLDAIHALTGRLTPSPGSPLALDVSPTGWQMVPSKEHRAHRLFQSGDFGNPYAGTFRERVKLPASLTESPGVRPVAFYSDGMPAILESTTAGAPLLIWNVALDPAKTDWPMQSVFLPAIAELLLGTRPQGTAESAYTLAGSSVSWTSGDPAHAGAIRLLDNSGNPVPITETVTADGTVWTSVGQAGPGLYRWDLSGQAVDHAAVNFPESESDLRTLDEAPTFGSSSTASGSLAHQATLAQGIPLWPWLVAATLLFLGLESLVHTRTPAIPTQN